MPSFDLVVDEPGQRLDRLVADALPELSRARVRALIDEGCVTVEGRALKPSARPERGARVRVEVPEARPSALTAQDLGLQLLFEDEDLAVLVKPAGLVVHPSKGHDEGTLVHGLLHALDELSGIGGEERPGVVHRLDKGTSGVMVVAKRDEAHRALKQLFSDHDIERRYLALVSGEPRLDAGHIENQLGRAPNDRFRFTAVARGGRRAETWWRVLERFGRAALVEARLGTGRTHQVRVHLSELGHPLLGDPLYRGRHTPPPEVRALLDGVDHQLLHARVLGFRHPLTGQALRFEVPPPEDFQRVLDGLRALRGGGDAEGDPAEGPRRPDSPPPRTS